AGLATANYAFRNNPITGTSGLLKQGSGSLLMDINSTYSGGTTISGGMVQLGNQDSVGLLGTGPVTDNGALIFDRPGNSTFANNISGTGSIIEEGNDTLQLAGTNTFNGAVLVTSNSTLQLGAYGILGTSVTTVTSGSTLDINGYMASGSVIAQGIGSDG